MLQVSVGFVEKTFTVADEAEIGRERLMAKGVEVVDEAKEG